MNLPRQAPPVMRGHDRGNHALPPHAAYLTATQSQAAGQPSLSALCTACALAPPPWNIVCSALCPIVFGRPA
jgi:hypothetical protein